MTHPALKPGNTALVTGAASGIGFAAAKRFARMGLNVFMIDRDEGKVSAAAKTILDEWVGEIEGATHPANVTGLSIYSGVADVSRREDLQRVLDVQGPIDVLMNNAAISPGSSVLDPGGWAATLDVNMMGVIHGTQVFAPGMIARGKPGLIINTGSKQGITTPPGNPAYNVAKAGMKVFTEALQHELRNTPGCQVTAHLLIPGFVWTGMTSRGRAEKPDGAWTADQTIDFMIDGVGRGDFYILCPDGETTRELDEKRMAWAMGDVIENRPPLSRWHPDYADQWRFVGLEN